MSVSLLGALDAARSLIADGAVASDHDGWVAVILAASEDDRRALYEGAGLPWPSPRRAIPPSRLTPRIMVALREGPQSQDRLASRLGVKANSVMVAVSRLRARGVGVMTTRTVAGVCVYALG